MAEESSSSRKKESTVALTCSTNSTRQSEDVDDLVKSPSHSPNDSSTRKVCTLFMPRAYICQLLFVVFWLGEIRFVDFCEMGWSVCCFTYSFFGEF